MNADDLRTEQGRSPYGERGLKCLANGAIATRLGRSPYGERGLKSVAGHRTMEVRTVALLTESVD